jgi:hypothetical protein
VPDKRRDPKEDTLLRREPMKYIAHVVRYMTKPWDATHQTSGSSHNSINTVQADLGKSKVKRRAVVQTVSYEGMNQGRCRSGRKGTSNHPKLTKLIVAGPCQGLEIFSIKDSS